MGIQCCHKCVPPKRHTACWDTCPDYIEDKAKEDKKKQAERERRYLDNAISEQRSRSIRRAMRKRKSR